MKKLHFIFYAEEMNSDDPEADLKNAAKLAKSLKAFLAWLEETHEYVNCLYNKDEKTLKAQAWDEGWQRDSYTYEMELVFDK